MTLCVWHRAAGHGLSGGVDVGRGRHGRTAMPSCAPRWLVHGASGFARMGWPRIGRLWIALPCLGWRGMAWLGVTLHCISLCLIGLHWIRLNFVAVDWIGVVWSGLDWITRWVPALGELYRGARCCRTWV